ncbi:MAG: glycosyl transferase [Candidatus Taylorbacteria bacterium CG11_big_fil_rev_8_21_14_0_20_46_11]|uniref:Glycosyl transferase n=1 Tax=Candidatus Taylorbacteria bacterium CG11_big_fil_rev_8_21_14_0_20_46_11 TaxID=1975025 RepID=A0A2H0KCT3_9BACT|nr:MAG: glycosyl transferase [Candidatus Taylorbacteria bacterium CG11_big_fil_rev_8_21_14_0_20_46_11]
MEDTKKKLSVIIPVFNEKATIREILRRVERVSLPDIELEIIVIDDGSTDGTREIVKGLSGPTVRTFFLPQNSGKGAAVRKGFLEARGDFVVIQDADLEYDPNEYSLLLAPLQDGRADAVFGSRFIGHRPHRVLFFWHYVANKFLTVFSNMLTDLNLSDIEVCYKAFTKDAVLSFRDKLLSRRFNIEPELVARSVQTKLRIYEVGISYSGRTYKEGKKINWIDGFEALWSIIRFNLFKF